MFTGKGLNLQNTKTEICLWEKYVTKCHFQEKWAHESISNQLDFMRKKFSTVFSNLQPLSAVGPNKHQCVMLSALLTNHTERVAWIEQSN